jgi:endo-1,4-beta-xylanase
MKTYIKLALCCCVMLACSKKEQAGTPATDDTTPPDTAGLSAHASFPVGASINIDLLKNNGAYTALVAKEFNSVTAENVMKMAAIQPTQGNFTFGQADYLVSFAQQHGMRIHGHTLVWYQALPDWVTNFNGDSTAWENILKTHIQTEVAHFKGKVVSWDVVNEAIDENGTLRNNVWLQHLGPDYIARCFQYAHQADPGALLFYNDYGHEYSAVKRAAIITLVTGMKSRGIPVDGFGMQMHTNTSVPDNDIAAAITAVANTGLKVHISELDISMNPNNDQNMTYTATIASAQSQKYQSLVKVYNALPAAQKFGITTWDVSDGDSWIPPFYHRPDWPLPFDASYKRKAAWQGIVNGLK